MNKKLVLAMILTLILTGILGITFRVQRVEASGTIYIRSDGSIEGTTDISTSDNVTYTFTDNIYDEIVVERDNIVVDGAGHNLQGTGSGTGIDLTERSNVTIKNMEIKKFWSGIELEASSHNTIFENTIAINRNGIVVRSSNNNSISGNNIANNDYGIFLASSSNNSVYENDMTNCTLLGISLCIDYYSNTPKTSENNVFYHNNFVNNAGIIDCPNCGAPMHVSEHIVTCGYCGHTAFIETLPPPISIDEAWTNVWDGGYPSGGNYWSDYEEKYSNATELDGSGIWNTPYVIDENNQDNYPLVPEFPTWASMLLLLIMLTVAIAISKRRLLRPR